MMVMATIIGVGLVLFQFSSYARFNEGFMFDSVIKQQLQHMSLELQQDNKRTDVSATTTTEQRLSENGFSFYYPTLRDASHFAKDPWNDVPYLHILETPLIQNQLNLTLLIESRLKLFETFCLPSMKRQTSRDFIWIVRIDTRLSTQRPQWLGRLIALLSNDSRFYLIERDSNPPWRNGESSKQLVQSKVYTGDKRRLEYYISMYQDKHIFETRIDGDDGLHYQYMQYIADESMKILLQNRILHCF